MKKIYLDTNIFVATFSNLQKDKSRKEVVEKAFNVLKELKDIELWTSMWTITEFVKVLTLEIKMDPSEIAGIEQNLLNESRLLGLKIKFADVSPISDYDFKEFFYNIRKGILAYNSGVGDVMHATIMQNNKIEYVLTSNIKDFSNIPGITVLDPQDIKFNKTGGQ